jgi:hypothetical protein
MLSRPKNSEKCIYGETHLRRTAFGHRSFAVRHTRPVDFRHVTGFRFPQCNVFTARMEVAILSPLHSGGSCCPFRPGV